MAVSGVEESEAFEGVWSCVLAGNHAWAGKQASWFGLGRAGAGRQVVVIVEVVKEIGSCCAGAGAAVVLLGGLSAAAWPRGWASDVRVGRSVLRRKEHGAA